MRFGRWGRVAVVAVTLAAAALPSYGLLSDDGSPKRAGVRAPTTPTTLPRTYTAAGVFTIRGSAWSGKYEGYSNPYSSRAEAELTIRVG